MFYSHPSAKIRIVGGFIYFIRCIRRAIYLLIFSSVLEKGFVCRYLLSMHVRWMLARDKDSMAARVNLKRLRGFMNDGDVQVLVC